ncbi:MAG: metal ABC transporter permease [Candidatus Zixiibacteriota bacterium]
MTDFLQAVFTYSFLQFALLGGVLASIACGVVGTWVVARRITYIAGGIAHTVLGGLGLAHWIRVTWDVSWLHPVYGAVVAAIVSAIIIGFVSLKARHREDTVIGALWAVGMAVGIICIAATPGYNQDLMTYLFGNILFLSPSDIVMILLLDVIVVGTGMYLYNQFTAVCFDQEYARVRGLNVDVLYIALLCLTALTVVILTTIVGIILVIALLTLPVATVSPFCKTLKRTMLWSIVISSFCILIGIAVSYSPNLPAGASIILVCGAFYFGSLLLSRYSTAAR